MPIKGTKEVGMMKLVMLILLMTSILPSYADKKTVLLEASPLEESEMDPSIERPKMPGSRVPIEDVNTAPTPTPEKQDFDTLQIKKRHHKTRRKQEQNREEEKKMKINEE
jgi:hypothetical protein